MAFLARSFLLALVLALLYFFCLLPHGRGLAAGATAPAPAPALASDEAFAGMSPEAARARWSGLAARPPG